MAKIQKSCKDSPKTRYLENVGSDEKYKPFEYKLKDDPDNTGYYEGLKVIRMGSMELLKGEIYKGMWTENGLKHGKGC